MNFPDGRTNQYAVWRACERLGISPPLIRTKWEDNDTETQALIIAYDQIRGNEDAGIEANRVAASFGQRRLR